MITSTMSKAIAVVMAVLTAVNLISILIGGPVVESFTSKNIHYNININNNISRQQQQQQQQRSHQSRNNPSLQATSLTTLPNPLKQLPWNVQKEREREVRRNNMERSKIFRQIGIAEDATYEVIVDATDRLIAAAGSNLKQKIQIEIMKDQILQHRLNERLNGLLAQERNTNKEARAMSNYEMEG